MDSKTAAQQQAQDVSDDYNSSEYTHTNIDPTISTNDETSATSQHDAPQSTAASVHDESHTRAMEAVMQLAQAASQQQYDQQNTTASSTEQEHQQHGHVENPDVAHQSLPVNNSHEGEKRGSKRSSSQTSPTHNHVRRPSKAARSDEHDVEAAAAAEADGQSSALPLLETWSEGNIPAEIQQVYQQHLAQAQANSTPSPHDDPSSSASPNFKPTRQLSTSKRAAQNRAAQRAFRERRDKYVKVLESKTARLEVAIKVASECKRRYTESVLTIDELRQDNHTLRVALAALSGTSLSNQPPPQARAGDLLASLPEVPLLTTEEEEAVLAGVQAGGGQSLEGLSAVAVAAAAATEAGGDGQGKGGEAEEASAVGEAAKQQSNIALPQPPSATTAAVASESQ